MNLTEFFSIEPKVIKPFVLFGKHHFVALISLFLFILTLTMLSRKNEKVKNKYKMFLLIAVPVQEIIYKLWAGVVHDVNFSIIFSLHLCSICIIIIAILLFSFKQGLFEILYFWGLGGATQALLTPDISVYGFPHFRFFQVFFSHGMILATVIYFIIVEGKKVRKGSLKKIILTTNIYALIVYVVNCFFGTNYMFLNHKPATASILDSLGPWPVYIIWMEISMFFIFSLLYIPVYKKRKKEERILVNLSSAS